MSKKTTTNKRVRINKANSAIDDTYDVKWQEKRRKQREKENAAFEATNKRRKDKLAKAQELVDGGMEEFDAIKEAGLLDEFDKGI